MHQDHEQGCDTAKRIQCFEAFDCMLCEHASTTIVNIEGAQSFLKRAPLFDRSTKGPFRDICVWPRAQAYCTERSTRPSGQSMV